VKRELGLDLDAARFEVIATYSMVWRMRQQPPETNGTADISTVHSLQLTAEEEGTVTMDPREYSDSRYFTLNEILDGDFHPCLKQAVRDLRKRSALDELLGAASMHAAAPAADLKDTEVATPSSQGAESGSTRSTATTAASSSSLVEAALAFCRAHRAATVSDEATKVVFKHGKYLSTSPSSFTDPVAAASAAALTAEVSAGGQAATEGTPAGFGGREDRCADPWQQDASDGGSSTAQVANAWLTEFPSAPPPGSSVVEAQLDAELKAAGISVVGTGDPLHLEPTQKKLKV
jgi:hypothetical protein